MVSDTVDLAELADSEWVSWESRDWTVGEDEIANILKTLSFAGLPTNRGFKATLVIRPRGWSIPVTLDTIYFTTNRVVGTISNLGDLLAVRSNPAGSYVVTADITGLNGYVLSSDRPFTGTIDFQGHSVTTTSFAPLFYKVSESGVVKNLEVLYNSVGTSTTGAYAWNGTVARDNYGTLQNVVVRYNPSNPGYGMDIYYSGGVCCYNYGIIDGFIVEFQKDVRANIYFGGVCMENRGLICNGYVTAQKFI